MNATAALPVVGVDLAKSVFQLAIADGHWRIVERQRLTRTQFERWFANRAVGLVVMEACGSAHHWARWLTGLGIEVRLLPAAVRARLREAQQDRRGRRRSAAGGGALRRHRPGAREIGRAAGPPGAAPHPLAVDGHAHRADQRTARLLPGVRHRDRPRRPHSDWSRSARVLADPNSAIPELVRPTMKLLVEEIRLLEARVGQLERELTQTARASAACTTLLTIPGVGLLTATAMVAATSGKRQPLPRCTALRRLVRPHAQGALLGQHASDRTHLQARGPLPADAPHPRGSLGAARSQRCHPGRPCRRRPARLGTRRAGANQSQQGDLRARQQARAHLLRLSARQRALRAGQAAGKEVHAQCLSNPSLSARRRIARRRIARRTHPPTLA